MPETKRDASADSEFSPIHQQHTSGPAPKLKPQLEAANQNIKAVSSSLTELDAPSFERVRSSQATSAQPTAADALSNSAVSGVRQVDLTQRAREQAEPATADMTEPEVGSRVACGAGPATAAVINQSDPALASSLAALTDAEAIPDSDAAALEEATDSVLSPKAASEPNVSTRSQTHVSEDMWLDTLLELPGSELDPRQRLAWRFKATFTAWKMLLPVCSPQHARAQLLEEMRRYERLLRESGPAPKNQGDKQLSDALHLQLTEAKTVELERALGELEGLLLSADASISQEAFKARWNSEHTDARQLLRYARLLASRRFGIGYRRDRFEALALELLTIRLPSGRLQLMPRRRAGQVLRQLLRGLYRPSLTGDDNKQSITYLREALDRLDAITAAKQFFDSGLYLDIYGYKISRHDRILSPEFLYLSVAIEVDVHNLLLSWSQTTAAESGRPFSLAPAQLQLRAQKEAAQAVFHDFHKPLAGSAAPPKAAESRPVRSQPSAQPKTKSKPAAQSSSHLTRFVAAALLVLSVVGANLYVSGAVTLRKPPKVLTQEMVKGVSPLLVNAKLSADGKRLSGNVSRPAWVKLSANERTKAAEQLANELKRRGIEHAQLTAYKERVIEIEFGSVVYVDEAPQATRSRGR